jgi:hypothetical protein
MSAYHVLIIEPLDDGLEMVSSVGPFASWTFARSAAHRFEQKRDAAGFTAADVKVRVAKQIAPEDFEWTPPSQRPRAEVVQITRQRKHRTSDPLTSRQADLFASSKSTSARLRIIEAHAAHPNGLTDEEAAMIAGLNMTSEYSTRCSELKRDGILEDTNRTRVGSTGLQRTVRQMTSAGLNYWREQKAATK